MTTNCLLFMIRKGSKQVEKTNSKLWLTLYVLEVLSKTLANACTPYGNFIYKVVQMPIDSETYFKFTGIA